jgi:hypothetical protein
MVHVFYDQAFDTLFSRHDATKEAFKRQRYTDLEIYEFKRIFGIFCLITYIEQISEFTESTVGEFIKRAGKIAGVKLRPDAFLKDIMNSVCVLQRDGLSIVFSHRSFQEYFCAYSFLKLSNDEAREVALRLSDRGSDNVMPMLFEMNKSFLEDVYFIPMMELTKDFLTAMGPETEIKEIIEFLGCGVIVQVLSGVKNRHKGKVHGYIQVAQGNEAFHFVYWLARLYDQYKSETSVLITVNEEESLSLRRLLPNIAEDNVAAVYNMPHGLRYMRLAAEAGGRWRQDNEEGAANFLSWLGESRFSAVFRGRVLAAKRIIEDLRSSRDVHRREVLSLLRRGDSRGVT